MKLRVAEHFVTVIFFGTDTIAAYIARVLRSGAGSDHSSTELKILKNLAWHVVFPEIAFRQSPKKGILATAHLQLHLVIKKTIKLNSKHKQTKMVSQRITSSVPPQTPQTAAAQHLTVLRGRWSHCFFAAWTVSHTGHCFRSSRPQAQGFILELQPNVPPLINQQANYII